MTMDFTSQTISQRGNRHTYDVVIVGSGIAALSYALQLAVLQPKVSIAIITKSHLAESNSQYAQGGIAAALAEDDSLALHVADTLTAGCGESDPIATENLLATTRECIAFLRAQGVVFDGDDEDAPQFGFEAMHSRRRILHCGDRTGASIITALIHQIKTEKNISVLAEHTAINLITNDPPHQPCLQKEVIGLYVLDNQTSLIHTLLAKIIVLASGGAGKIYRYTTNPETATGDGVAMAYRIGARVTNLEFYQFHPTLLFHNKVNNFLISEAVRGEGAYLRLPDTGERFMQRYDSQAMELARRDVVARAIFNEIEKSHHDFVYLDIRHRERDYLQKRFPMIFETLLSLGMDMSVDLIPVVPAAHYMCGGILTDIHGQTDIKRLLAIGETAHTGLHGANRLASNSLLEGVAMARNAAKYSLPLLNEPIEIKSVIEDWNSRSVIDTRRATQINAHWRSIRGEMNSYAGIIRTEAGLQDLLRLLQCRRVMVEKYYWDNLITRDSIELRNIICVAELLVKNAIKRRESCGSHFREDSQKAAIRMSTTERAEK